ncbi:MAG: hypothetical protein ACRDQA_29855 [Nocardioidaceae bacterium]
MASRSGLTRLLTRPSRPARSVSPLSFDRLDARVVVVFGALAIGLNGPLADVSGAAASTASFYRALFAVAIATLATLSPRPPPCSPSPPPATATDTLRR